MNELVNETVEIARKYFKGVGFDDAQTASLLQAGKRDLTNELNKMEELLESECVDIDAVNLSLHALKGLFLTMGDNSMGEKLNEIRKDNMSEHKINEIKMLLRVG